VEVLTTVLTVAGMGYYLAAMVAARIFLADRRAQPVHFAPGVSILKSLKGLDPGMIEAFRSHCRQNYSGEYELLFGVSSLSDPAVSAVEQLSQEFPDKSIQLIECPERLGTNGKVSTLVQLAPHASLRLPADQRLRYHRLAPLPGAGDGLLRIIFRRDLPSPVMRNNKLAWLPRSIAVVRTARCPHGLRGWESPPIFWPAYCSPR
jgi:hypothetical protein